MLAMNLGTVTYTMPTTYYDPFTAEIAHLVRNIILNVSKAQS